MAFSALADEASRQAKSIYPPELNISLRINISVRLTGGQRKKFRNIKGPLDETISILYDFVQLNAISIRPQTKLKSSQRFHRKFS